MWPKEVAKGTRTGGPLVGHRDRLDFDEELVREQPRHLDQRHRRPGSGSGHGKELVARRPVVGDAAHVAHEHSELREVAHRASDGGQRHAEVAERLLRLRAEVVTAYEVALTVRRYLTGDIGDTAALDRGDVRIAGWRRQLDRV